jgi:hypothetical protein
MEDPTPLEQSAVNLAEIYAAIEAAIPLIKTALEKAMEAAMRELPDDEQLHAPARTEDR